MKNISQALNIPLIQNINLISIMNWIFILCIFYQLNIFKKNGEISSPPLPANRLYAPHSCRAIYFTHVLVVTCGELSSSNSTNKPNIQPFYSFNYIHLCLLHVIIFFLWNVNDVLKIKIVQALVPRRIDVLKIMSDYWIKVVIPVLLQIRNGNKYKHAL